MKKLIGTLVFLVLLVPLAYKVLIWGEVYYQLKQVKQSFAPYGIIDWGGIYSTFDGQIGVVGLSVTPFQLKETIQVDEVEADFKGLASLLTAIPPLLSGAYPNSLTFNIRGARLALSDTSLGMLQPDNKRLTDLSLSRIYACGEIKLLTGRELRAMGYESIEYDGMVAYHTDPMAGKLAITSQLEAVGMGQAKTDLLFDFGGDFSPAKVLGDAAMLKRVNLSLKDLGYYRRLAFLCGRLNNLSQTEYILASLKEWRETLQASGIGIPEDFISALNEYMALGAQLEMQFEPRQGLFRLLNGAWDESGKLSRPESLVAGLNPSFRLSWGQLQPLEIDFNQKRLALALLSEGEIQEKARKVKEELAAEPEIRIEYRYVGRPISRLPENVGQPIRVYLIDGKVHEGQLKSMTDEHLEVAVKQPAGSFSFPVPLEMVERVEVLKRLEIEVPATPRKE